VKLFAKSWEDKEKELLSEDVDRQLSYIENLPLDWKEQVLQYVEIEEKGVEEKGSSFDDIKEANPKEHEYELENCKLEKLRELIADKNSNLQEYFIKLKEYRILKFP